MGGEPVAKTYKLNPLDAAWLMVESTDTPMHVGSLTIFSLPKDASPDFLRDTVASLKQHRNFAPPFNLKLVSPKLKGVLPAWIEDHKIDLDYHFRHSALPAPGGERELGVLISRLHSHPLDFNRPLWECHLIEGLEHNRFALYVKMHHSQVDGVGGMKMLERMLSPDPSATDRLPPWAVGRGGSTRPQPVRAPLARRLKALALAQAETLPGVIKALREVVSETFRQTDPAHAAPFVAPKSILNRKIGGQRRFATQYYELERIRRIAKAAEVTVNDVFLELCSGALRRYLDEIQALPNAPLTAGVPVSVRPADDGDSGNAISFIIANLNTHLADPLKRLKAIQESTNIAKEKLQALPKAGINNYTMVFMAPYILSLLTGLGGRTRPMFNVTISNVPGPREYQYFNCARMEQMYPISLLSHGQALNITVVSYAGQFNVGFTGCRDTLPHMQRLATYMAESLEELERAVEKLEHKRRKAA
ncbi:MAG: wax ester/triacylglycerol synthase family O-acyltransferase [Nevskiaceae bacterium]|nr:MAG: wax ester/triacylglycerol synthase family O-acyltransferase [Nevskiaceae bacterium]